MAYFQGLYIMLVLGSVVFSVGIFLVDIVSFVNDFFDMFRYVKIMLFFYL